MALSNADYDAIMRIYNDRQLHNLRDLDERRKEAFERFPRLREIAEETASLSVQKAKALLGEAGVQDFNLDERLLDLAEERSVLLTAGGYPEDYLEMHYTCPVCRDTGFVDGKKCSCFLQEEIRYLYSGSNDREILERENFDHFNLDYYSGDVRDGNGISPREAAEAAYGEARQFLANFDREPENLLFGTWEYHGTDFAADMARMAADEKNQEWWAFTIPCQKPLETRAEGEWWAMMEEVFHHD